MQTCKYLVIKLFLLSLFSIAACSTNQVTSSNLSKNQASNTFTEKTVYEIFQNRAFQIAELDSAPVPIGGEDNFLRTMYRKINYPPQARKKGIQGVVQISVIIDEFGRLENAEVNESVGYGCDQEALAAVRRGGELGFEPAQKDGKAVKVKYNIPVKFKLH